METIGFTCGCFDLLHAGHVEFLTECRKKCDRLLVAVATDRRVKELNKGEDRPIFPLDQRLLIVQSLKPVSECWLDKEGPIPFLKLLRPNIYFKATDWEGKLPAEEVELCKKLGIKISFIPRTRDVSTTSILTRIRGE